jgi:hypothetical protein
MTQAVDLKSQDFLCGPTAAVAVAAREMIRRRGRPLLRSIINLPVVATLGER